MAWIALTIVMTLLFCFILFLLILSHDQEEEYRELIDFYKKIEQLKSESPSCAPERDLRTYRPHEIRDLHINAR